MLTIGNEQLQVHLLDPAADLDRLGVRYCHGGYIWQVVDRVAGPLVTGPEGPAPRPRPFNGHGLPEAFRDRTRDGRELTWQNGRGLAIGVGILERDGDNVPQIAERCDWTIVPTPLDATYATHQEDGGRAYVLRRRIRVLGNRVMSTTELTNTGRLPLDLQWFAHPFFPLDAELALTIEFPEGAVLEPNPDLRFSNRAVSLGRRFRDVTDGQFAQLNWPPDRPFSARVTQQPCQEIAFAADFAPNECPVWANAYTISVEPYQTLHLEPDASRAWTLTYQFGAL